MQGKLLKGAIIFCGINIIGSLLPLFATMISASIFEKETIPFSKFLENGEINIICIPICISILFSLYQYKRQIGINRWADFIFGTTLFLLAISIVIYAYGMSKPELPTDQLQSKKTSEGLSMFSKWFLVWTIIGLFVSKFIEDDTLMSLKDSRNNEQNSLESKFNNSRK